MIIDNSDNTTLVTYSIIFYYRKDFAKVTFDMQGWFEWAVNTQNQIFINSQIPIRAKIFCIEEESRETRKKYLPLKTADQRIHVGLKGCGLAFGGVHYRNSDDTKGFTLSYWSKSCASGINAISHETGHNFGCYHHVEMYKPKEVYETLNDRVNADAPYGFRNRNFSIGTAMGGNSIPYFSNPNIIHPETGVRLGVRGVSNCAGVIRRHRFSWARNGDETGVCSSKSKAKYNTIYCNSINIY